jgi:hypothetical protein
MSPSRFAFIPYEASVETTALTKNTIQQLSQKPLLFKLKTLLILSFFVMNLKADTKPSFTTNGLGGGLINF